MTMEFCKHGTYSGWQRCIPCARKLKSLLENYGHVQFKPLEVTDNVALMTIEDKIKISVQHNNLEELMDVPLNNIFHHIISID